jgi:uncharacterized protein
MPVFRPFRPLDLLGITKMPYFALIYDLVHDYLERRAPLRNAHLSLATQSHARGELVLAGAFTDPPDKALLVFKSADRSVAESFAKNDPYVLNGLIRHWQVRSWNVVVGDSKQLRPIPGEGA